MKGILEFNLPEESQEFNTAFKAMQLVSVITDLNYYIRSLQKIDHNLETGDQALDKIHLELWALVEQHSVEDLV